MQPQRLLRRPSSTPPRFPWPKFDGPQFVDRCIAGGTETAIFSALGRVQYVARAERSSSDQIYNPEKTRPIVYPYVAPGNTLRLTCKLG